MNTIGDRIKYLRESKNLSKAALGRELGTDATNIGKWESNDRVPGGNFIILLSRFFDVTTDWILTGGDFCLKENIRTNKESESSEKNSESEYEKELINLFRDFSEYEQQTLLLILKGMAMLIKNDDKKNPVSEKKVNESSVNEELLNIATSNASSISYNHMPVTSSINLPVMGVAAAGIPMEAIAYIEGYLTVPDKYKHCFVVKIKGKSMINIGMEDGGYAIVRQQQDVENGDLALVMVDNNATIKRIRKESNKITLIPENNDMKPIVCDNSNEIKILGKVVNWYSSQEAADIYKVEN